MEDELVTRSRVFREAFFPGAFVRLRAKAYAKVVGVRSSSFTMDGVDKEQISEAVRSFIADWETAGGVVDNGLRLAADRRAIEIQSPNELYVTPMPLLLTCTKCKVIEFGEFRGSDAQLLEAARKRVRDRGGFTSIPCRRSGCAGRMVQLPFVSVHRCGIAKPIFIHFSARGRQDVGFKDNGAFFQSRFFNVDTGQDLARALQDACPHCSGMVSTQGVPFTEINKRGTPITNGESYYTQLTQFIALSEERGKLLSHLMAAINAYPGAVSEGNRDIVEGISSALLRIVSVSEFEQHFTGLLNGPQDNGLSQEEVQEKLERQRQTLSKLMAMDMDEDTRETLAASTKDKIAELEKSLKGQTGAFAGVRNLIAEDRVLAGIASQRRALEAILLPRDVRAVSMAKAIKESADPVQRELLAGQWQLIQSNYGVENIQHIPDLRVVLAAVGFSREKSVPRVSPMAAPVVLNGFSDEVDPQMRGRTPVYALSAKTEAVWIRLAPQKVLAWCVGSAGWSHPGSDVLTSPERSLSHLLSECAALRMSPGRVAKDTNLLDPLKSAPFHLLHSVAHSLMHSARRHTGYDTSSVMEYLLPMDLSFLLYVSSVQNFTAGGLLTLFNHHLHKWFDDASMFAFNCAYDPVCSDAGGSCSGCLQLELACETFNAGLSRAYIHGGQIDREGDDVIGKGYWDVS